MDLLESCQKFISIDSSPEQGLDEIVNYAASLCRELGLDVETEETVLGGVTHKTLLARPNKSDVELDEDQLLLHTHLNTHDPGTYGLWSRTDENPFQATIFNNRLYGLGASNIKLDFLCKLKSMENLLKKGLKFKKSFVLCATYDLDKGVREIVRLIRKKKVTAKQALIGASTNLNICDGAKGTVSVEISILFSEQEILFRSEHNLKEGASSHSRMFMGKSGGAVLELLKYLAQLPDGIAVLDVDGGISKDTEPSYASLEFDCTEVIRDSITQKIRTILWALELIESEFTGESSGAAINIGVIRTTKDQITLKGVCHIPAAVKEDIYGKWIENLESACLGVDASFRVLEYTRPYVLEKKSKLLSLSVEALTEAGINTEVVLCEESNEANIFNRLGVESVLFGAGERKEKLQNHNESVSIDDLNKSVQFYESVIEKICC